jgi:hypothetical protein
MDYFDLQENSDIFAENILIFEKNVFTIAREREHSCVVILVKPCASLTARDRPSVSRGQFVGRLFHELDHIHEHRVDPPEPKDRSNRHLFASDGVRSLRNNGGSVVPRLEQVKLLDEKSMNHHTGK